jgi:pimeloyl-ACP methyl ester carboxylesterase
MPMKFSTRLKRATTALAASVVGLVSINGCGSADSSPASFKIDTRTKYAFQPCPTTLADETVLCGVLTVPEDRSKADSRLLGLSFFLLPAKTTSKSSDPVAFLLGGPGSIVPGIVGASKDDLQIVWRSKRDVILLNYRGFEGTSPKSLDCAELDPTTKSFATETEVTNAVASCKGRLKQEGFNTAAYTTDTIAIDLEELRILLGKQRGFEKWNVVGSSYGTRVAQTYLREFPNSIRAVALDGPSPLDSSIGASVALGNLEAINTLISLCNGQPMCASSFPNLKANLSDTLIKISSKPIDVEGVKFGVSEMLTLIAGATTSPDDLAGVPLFIERVSADDLIGARAAIPTLFDLALTGFAEAKAYNPIPFGANYAIRCVDELGLPEQQGALPSVAKDWPTSVSRAALKASSVSLDQSLCNIWTKDIQPIDAKKRIVFSSTPALITVGQFDPTTPKSLATILSGRLTKSQTVIIAGSGHGLLESGDQCAFALHGAFIDAPDKPLSTQCAEGSGIPIFLKKAK